MISHPSVAGAAVLAGLMVAGGGYAARHDVGLGSGLQASATARAALEQELLPARRERHVARHILTWHPPHVPKIHVQAPPAQVTLAAAPAPTYTTAAPVASAAPVTSAAAPVTRTSPVGGDDGSGDD